MVIKLKTNSGTNITDIMRFFHCDSPAHQLGSGQQRGVNFYCPVCCGNAQQALLSLSLHLLVRPATTVNVRWAFWKKKVADKSLQAIAKVEKAGTDSGSFWKMKCMASRGYQPCFTQNLQPQWNKLIVETTMYFHLNRY